jgi:L-threonine kinase
MLGQSHFLVTCPIDFYSRVTVEIFEGRAGVSAPPDCPKSRAAVAAALVHLGRTGATAVLTISNPIPRGKGMASSSADVTGAIAATGLALGRRLPPGRIGELALSVEPSDGVMFPGIALFDHREGSIVEELGPPPPMEIVALDFGGTVDTLEFNQIDRHDAWHSLEPVNQQALDLVRRGIRQGNPALVGQGASISAAAGQRILEKPQLPRVEAFAESVGAVGVCVAHSGTVIGVLLDARERRGKATFRRALAAFGDAAAVHHFRLMSGGVRAVDPPDGRPAGYSVRAQGGDGR